jgi:hypothetical protein
MLFFNKIFNLSIASTWVCSLINDIQLSEFIFIFIFLVIVNNINLAFKLLMYSLLNIRFFQVE